MKLQSVLKQHWMRYSIIPLALLALFLTACSSDGGGIAPSQKVIVSVNPAINSNTAAITATVSIVFGVDMDKASVESEFSLSQGGAPVAGTVVYDVPTKTAVLTPVADLSYSTSYTATLNSDVLDATGTMPLTSDYSWSFSTVGVPPTIVSVSPENGSDTSLVTTTVSILFGIPMDKASVENEFTLMVTGGAAVPGTAVYTSGNNTAVFTPSADLSSGMQYTATLSNSVEDANNNMPLTSDYVWSFTIAPVTVLASTNANGMVGPTGTASTSSDIDSEGRYIVFVSSEQLTSVPTVTTVSQVYRKDTQTGITRLVSTATGSVAANNTSSNPVVNSTGRYIAFTSTATNLSSTPTSSGIEQVYLKDIQTGDIQMVSRASASEAGNNVSRNAAISENGNMVVFESLATNLDGGGGVSNIFLFNTNSGIMERITVPAAAGNPNDDSVKPDISNDGRYVAFVSTATNLGSCTTGQGDIFVRDRTAATYTCISLDTGGGDANAASTDPAISGDGSTVVFSSIATDIVTGNGLVPDIFKRDSAASGPATLVSITSTGTDVNNGSILPSVSSDGRFVSFESSADNVVANDMNGASDVFVRDTAGGNAAIVRVSLTADGIEGSFLDDSGNSRISDNGRYVSFDSLDKLDPADTNGTNIADVYRGHNASYP